MKNSFWVKLAAAAAAVCLVSGAGAAIILSETPQSAVMAGAEGRNGARLILDPGHGGADGGAVSVTGTSESRLNLDVALRARALAGLYGVPALMTRESEDIDYPEDARTIHAKKVADTRAREALVASVPDAVLISIHQNKYTTSGPRGSQVFYAPTEGSEALAGAVGASLGLISGDNSRGAVRIGKDVYLMNHIQCPGILVECGFVSNPAEARLLEDPSYQLKLAAAIIGGYIGSLS